MKHICITIGMAMILILPFTAQAGQASPSILADACAACHGSDGKSPSTIPSIQASRWIIWCSGSWRLNRENAKARS